MPIRGIRGATVAEADTPEAIRAATREMLQAITEAKPNARRAENREELGARQ